MFFFNIRSKLYTAAKTVLSWIRCFFLSLRCDLSCLVASWTWHNSFTHYYLLNVVFLANLTIFYWGSLSNVTVLACAILATHKQDLMLQTPFYGLLCQLLIRWKTSLFIYIILVFYQLAIWRCLFLPLKYLPALPQDGRSVLWFSHFWLAPEWQQETWPGDGRHQSDEVSETESQIQIWLCWKFLWPWRCWITDSLFLSCGSIWKEVRFEKGARSCPLWSSLAWKGHLTEDKLASNLFFSTGLSVSLLFFLCCSSAFSLWAHHFFLLMCAGVVFLSELSVGRLSNFGC